MVGYFLSASKVAASPSRPLFTRGLHGAERCVVISRRSRLTSDGRWARRTGKAWHRSQMSWAQAVVEGTRGGTALMDKSTRGNASQFFIAGELCRRGYSAVVTLGNTPNTDILCSNIEGTEFVHIQAKTFIPGIRTCSVGKKAEKVYGPNFFWVLGGIPKPDCRDQRLIKTPLPSTRPFYRPKYP